MSGAAVLQPKASINELIAAMEAGEYLLCGDLIGHKELVSLETEQVARVCRLLIEGGYYEAVVLIGQRIVKGHRVKLSAATAKLFSAFASFFTSGTFEGATAGIEEVLESKEGRSNDLLRARCLDVLGRSLALSVSFRLTPDELLLRAKNLVGEACRAYERNGNVVEHVRGLQALAQMNCSGSYPDLISAVSVLKAAEKVCLENKNEGLRAEVVRRIVEIECLGSDTIGSVAEIRRAYASIVLPENASSVMKGSHKVSLSRVLRNKGLRSDDELDSGTKSFESCGYLSGLYETLSATATVSVEQGHFARALRKFRELLDLAHRMGFSQGMAVAQLGIFQVHVGLGEVDEARAVANSLLKLSRSPAISGSLGLSMAAAFQLLGDLPKALEVAKGASRLFANQRLFDQQSQALFVEGSCLAGLNRWNEALRIWRKAAKVDEDAGNYVAQADKLIACAQAEVMHDLVENNKVSEVSLARALKVLSNVSKSLAGKGIQDGRVRAKIHQTEAQLFVVARDMMRALKSYSSARNELMQIGAMRDVAFVDAQVGLTLLDLGKTQYPHMLDEALDSFRRALDYCTTEHVLTLRWKIQYYLAFGCLLIAQTKASVDESAKWQDAAREWLKGARADVATLQEHGASRAPIDGDFSPSLTFDVIEALTKELQPKTSGSKKGSQNLVIEVRPKVKGGQWH